MDGVMPMSIGLTDTAARAIGREVQSGLSPLIDVLTVPLDRFGQQIDQLGQQLMNGFVQMTLLLGSLNQVRFGIPVQVTNLAILQTLTFGVLSMSLFIFLVLVLIFTRLGIISSQLFQIHADLGLIHDDLVSLTVMTAVFGALTTALLSQILAELRKGLKLDGVINLNINIAGLPTIDLGKLLGLLGIALGFLVLFVLALAAIVAFVGLLAEAFALFTGQSILAVAAVTAFLYEMAEMIKLIAGFDWATLGKIGVGLLGIAAFVALLGLAFRAFKDNAKDLMEPLSKFLETMGKLAVQLSKFDKDQLISIGVSFLLMAALVAGVGFALRAFNDQAVSIMGPLGALLQQLGALAASVANFNTAQLISIGVTFTLMALLVAGLGFAFRAFNDQAVSIMGPLGKFLDQLKDLATQVANFDTGQLIRMGVGFLLLGLFVAGMGLALRAFNDQAIATMGALVPFLAALTALAILLASLDTGQLIRMGVALLLLALFVAGLGLALRTFNEQSVAVMGPLTGLLNALQSLAALLAGLSAGDIVGMGFSLALLAGFIAVLGLALDEFTAQSIAALPALSGLIDSLTNLTATTANLGVGDIIAMGVALALLAGFIAVIGFVSDECAPGLLALAAALAEVNALLNTLMSIAGAVGSALSEIGSAASSAASAVGGVLSTVGGGALSAINPFQEGGDVEHTGPAYLHEGERVLTRGETQAMDSALGAAPASAGSPSIDQSINVGGVTVNVHAEHVDAGAADMLSDAIVAKLQEKLASLHTEQQFRTGYRAATA
jgi:hypothetical protein